jgi:hypothetical protein
MGGSIEETDTTSSWGEFGIVILLAILAKQFTHGIWTIAILSGTSGGAEIFVRYGITDGLISR